MGISTLLVLIHSGLNRTEVAARLDHSPSACSKIYVRLLDPFTRALNMKVRTSWQNKQVLGFVDRTPYKPTSAPVIDFSFRLKYGKLHS